MRFRSSKNTFEEYQSYKENCNNKCKECEYKYQCNISDCLEVVRGMYKIKDDNVRKLT